MLILLLLLQMTTFQTYVVRAQIKLGLAPVRVEQSSARSYAAWVPYGPGAAWIIYVRPDFLREADPLAQRIVAAHECCHLYIGNSRRYFLPGEEALAHAMIGSCVEWVLGDDLPVVMSTIPCQRWYPNEVIYYNRRIGRRPCIEKR